MFNLGKSNEEQIANIKGNASDLVDNTLDSAAEVASDVQYSVKKTANKLQEKTSNALNNTKDDAMTLIENLKALLSDNASKTDYNRIKNEALTAKDEALDKANEWKDVVQYEVTSAIENANAKTKKVITEQPLLSLGIAVGAGVLLGYVLGNKQSNK